MKVGANLAYGGLSPRELFKRSLVSVRVDTGVTLVINPTFPYLEGISRTFQATFKETAHADEGGWVSLGAPYEECRLVGRPARVKNRRATPQGRALADRVGLDPPPFLARVEATSVDDDEVMADGAHISRPLREFHVGEVIFHNCNEEGGAGGCALGRSHCPQLERRPAGVALFCLQLYGVRAPHVLPRTIQMYVRARLGYQALHPRPGDVEQPQTNR